MFRSAVINKVSTGAIRIPRCGDGNASAGARATGAVSAAAAAAAVFRGKPVSSSSTSVSRRLLTTSTMCQEPFGHRSISNTAVRPLSLHPSHSSCIRLKQQLNQRRSFYDEPQNLEVPFKPWEEVLLDLAGWYVAMVLLYPTFFRGDDELDDGSWRDEPQANNDDDKRKKNKISHHKNGENKGRNTNNHKDIDGNEEDQRH
jgi:hypothetical protein